MRTPAGLTILARTNWRERIRPFGIKQHDRLQHLYVIGQTGTGKSTLLLNLMKQDLLAGRGFAFLDPHGDAVTSVHEDVPPGRHGETIYFDPADPRCVLGFNPLESVPEDQRALAASGIIEAFKNVWGQYWGPRLEHIFRNALLTLLDQPSATLADLSRLFSDEGFRRQAVEHITHPPVREFWTEEFGRSTASTRANALGPLRNKLGAFLSQPSLYRVLTKERSDFDLRRAMDHGQVLLVNLSKGRMGSDAASLLGALLVTRISLAALSRADVAEADRRAFFVYLDEFQNFTTLSVATMLSELRKYGVGLVVAHQYVSQVAPEVRDAIMGNVGTMLAFRIGPPDARLVEKYFQPELSAIDLVRLPNYNLYVRLMVDGEVSIPFSAEALPPFRPRPSGQGAREVPASGD